MILCCVTIETLSIIMTDQILSNSILEITPKIVRFLREQMRKQAKGELTVPQFRVLLKLVRESSTTHQEVAEWMGIAAPTLTRMIDTLVKRKLVKRVKDTKDLRRTLLSATAAGQNLHQLYREEAQRQLLLKMEPLSSEEKEVLTKSFSILSQLFS